MDIKRFHMNVIFNSANLWFVNPFHLNVVLSVPVDLKDTVLHIVLWSEADRTAQTFTSSPSMPCTTTLSSDIDEVTAENRFPAATTYLG